VGLIVSHLLRYTVSVVGFCWEHFGLLGLDVMLPARAVLRLCWLCPFVGGWYAIGALLT
jgi:hypothetical protein